MIQYFIEEHFFACIFFSLTGRTCEYNDDLNVDYPGPPPDNRGAGSGKVRADMSDYGSVTCGHSRSCDRRTPSGTRGRSRRSNPWSVPPPGGRTPSSCSGSRTRTAYSGRSVYPRPSSCTRPGRPADPATRHNLEHGDTFKQCDIMDTRET